MDAGHAADRGRLTLVDWVGVEIVFGQGWMDVKLLDGRVFTSFQMDVCSSFVRWTRI